MVRQITSAAVRWGRSAAGITVRHADIRLSPADCVRRASRAAPRRGAREALTWARACEGPGRVRGHVWSARHDTRNLPDPEVQRPLGDVPALAVALREYDSVARDGS